MSKKVSFGSRIGLIAATAGSAVGLGNVWRFPAETQANGGAAFLLVYIASVFLLGIPAMLAEFSLGRAGHSDAIGAFRKLRPGSKWGIVGAMAILTSYLILTIYFVISGWTFEYLWESLSGDLYSMQSSAAGAEETFFSGKMQRYIRSDMEPIIFTSLMILFNLGAVLLGVRKGIEKLSNIMMPLLLVLLLIFAGVSLTLPGAMQGLDYFLRPDFSKITAGTLANALGQAFFSLSLGMGALITYAAYYPAKTNLPSTAATVALLDMLVAILMGIVIFPAVASFGLTDAQLEGTTLVFVTLPEVFSRLPMSQLWSALFFLLLMMAALTSTLSLSEVSISMIEEHFHKSRRAACMITMLPLFLLSSIMSLSLGDHGLSLMGMSLFDIVDSITANIMLPVCALFTCIFIGWFAPKGVFAGQLTNAGSLNRRLSQGIILLVKYAAPALLTVILAASFIKF